MFFQRTKNPPKHNLVDVLVDCCGAPRARLEAEAERFYHDRTGAQLGEHLVRLGVISAAMLNHALRKQDIRKHGVTKKAAAKIREEMQMHTRRLDETLEKVGAK